MAFRIDGTLDVYDMNAFSTSVELQKQLVALKLQTKTMKPASTAVPARFKP